MKLHLDTDIGGDIDDLCALAFLLRHPGVELTGITTVGEWGGKRAGYVRYALALEGRNIPVAAGADVSEHRYRVPMTLPPEERYWPEPVPACPSPSSEALDLLEESIEQGATVVGIGPYTNLAWLEWRNPGILRNVPLFLMGGFLAPCRPGYPQWRNEDDFNVQVDVESAQIVFERSSPTLVPLNMTAETALRRAYLPSLQQADDFGRLIVRQAEQFAIDEGNEKTYAETCPALPKDTINSQHDSLACAVALGWTGAIVEEMNLAVEERNGWLIERPDRGGHSFRVVTRVDGHAFNEFWLKAVSRRS